MIVRVVFDIESDPPRPIGTFVREDEAVVIYTTPHGTFANAPLDCVTVIAVDPISPQVQS